MKHYRTDNIGAAAASTVPEGPTFIQIGRNIQTTGTDTGEHLSMCSQLVQCLEVMQLFQIDIIPRVPGLFDAQGFLVLRAGQIPHPEHSWNSISELCLLNAISTAPSVGLTKIILCPTRHEEHNAPTAGLLHGETEL